MKRKRNKTVREMLDDPMFNHHPPLEGEEAEKFLNSLEHPDMSKMSKEAVEKSEIIYRIVMKNSGMNPDD